MSGTVLARQAHLRCRFDHHSLQTKDGFIASWDDRLGYYPPRIMLLLWLSVPAFSALVDTSKEFAFTLPQPSKPFAASLRVARLLFDERG
jgi:hypothetical protein